MSESGLMISRKVMASRLGQMGQDMKAFTVVAKNMELENLNGLTDPNTTENLVTIILKDRANTHGQTDESTLEVGKIIKCMDAVCFSGPMGDRMMANILMIRNMDSGNSTGQMERFTKEIGSTADSMA